VEWLVELVNEKKKHSRELTLVALGRDSSGHDAYWRDAWFIAGVTRLAIAAPSGRRRGSRIFGLGLDAGLVAMKVLFTARRGPFLASNPWVGAALKLLGRRDVSVTGIYASRGSRSFTILRRILRSAPVVTTVALEAEAWVAEGGIATPVLYGNTFGYPVHEEADSSVLRIFIGGSSDRDYACISKLEAELRSSSRKSELIVVADEAPSNWSNDFATIQHTGRISAQEFGDRIAKSDVVFLPLLQNGRAAGHMVTVGALESGVPVVSTDTPGMQGYVDGRFVRYSNDDEALLDQLEVAAEFGKSNRGAIRDYWMSKFSLSAYISRVGAALASIR